MTDADHLILLRERRREHDAVPLDWRPYVGDACLVLAIVFAVAGLR